jgi:branched-chain amino acid aminotransferase
MKKTKYIWMNGRFVEWNEAKIHVLSHVVQYGTGVFEGIRCYYLEDEESPGIFRLDDHVNRLFNSAKIHFMEMPYSKAEVKEACVELIKRNGLKNCYIRPCAYRSYIEKDDTWGYIGLNHLRSPVGVAIASWVWPEYGAPILRCLTSNWVRISPNAFPTIAKTSGPYVASSTARCKVSFVQELADKAGTIRRDQDGRIMESYEAILLDNRGLVGEGTGENFFIVKDGVVMTPPIHASILEGITRHTVFQLARDSGYQVQERDLTLGEVYIADECFMTGTAVEVKPVIEVDFHKIGNGEPGHITMELKRAFTDLVEGRNSKYMKWITSVA